MTPSGPFRSKCSGLIEAVSYEDGVLSLSGTPSGANAPASLKLTALSSSSTRVPPEGSQGRDGLPMAGLVDIHPLVTGDRHRLCRLMNPLSVRAPSRSFVQGMKRCGRVCAYRSTNLLLSSGVHDHAPCAKDPPDLVCLISNTAQIK